MSPTINIDNFIFSDIDTGLGWERLTALEQQNDLSLKTVKGVQKSLRLTDNEVISNTMLFFVAAVDTTVNSLGFLYYSLAKNPEIQAKMRKEISENIGSSALDFTSIHSLPYMDMVLSESQRMNAVASGWVACIHSIIGSFTKLVKDFLC